MDKGRKLHRYSSKRRIDNCWSVICAKDNNKIRDSKFFGNIPLCFILGIFHQTDT